MNYKPHTDYIIIFQTADKGLFVDFMVKAGLWKISQSHHGEIDININDKENKFFLNVLECSFEECYEHKDIFDKIQSGNFINPLCVTINSNNFELMKEFLSYIKTSNLKLMVEED